MLRLLKGSRILSSIKYRCKYSHHIKDKGNDGADDNKSVHQVPYVSEIGTRMGNHTQINDLNDHLGDDGQVFNGHEKITFKSISIAKIPVKT